jgi:prolipoprotein diacylglyceryl transferase
VWHGGLASHGGTIGIFIAIYFYSKKVTKRSMLWTFDRLIIPSAIVATLIRVGNLMNSEIYGFATTMPWGFIFERNGETVAKHPTQIYEALCYFVTFVLLYNFYYKSDTLKNRPGFLFGVFLTCIFGSRFFIEFIKENQVTFEETMALNMGQLLSIPFIIGGIVLFVNALNKPPRIYKY